MMVIRHESTGRPVVVLPRHRSGTAAWVGAVVGAVLAVVWSYQLVDDVIGKTLASELMGREIESVQLTGIAGILTFAVVSGIAGSFTACNIAAFSAIGPLTSNPGHRGRLSALARAMGWLLVGSTMVAAPYGALSAMMGASMPQLSTATIGGFPVRLLYAGVVFVAIGLVMLYIGLVAAGRLRAPGPLAQLSPRGQLIGLGALIGTFLIGRPFPMFMQLYEASVERQNPLLGALAFTAQAVGNVVILAIIVAVVVLVGGRRLQRSLTASPHRLTALLVASFVGAGAFLVLYWGVRVPAMFGIGWFPQMPWNAV